MLGDLERADRPRRGSARRQYALIGVIQRLLAANGVTDRPRDRALRRRPRHQAAARRSRSRALAQRERPSIDGDDVLAWALARNGHCGEALRYSKRALRLGTLDALKIFHRGMIERCLGRRAQARSVASGARSR